MLNNNQKQYIRDISKQFKEYCESDKNQKLIQKYKDINSLKLPGSPTFTTTLPNRLTDEYCKKAADELRKGKSSPISDDPVFSGIESHILWLMGRVKYGDDFPVSNTIHTGRYYWTTPWMEGMKSVSFGIEKTSVKFEPCLIEYSDFKKMRVPELHIDRKIADSKYEQINDVLGDILPVVKGAPYFTAHGWGDSMIDQYFHMRGNEQTYYDLADAPGFVHEVMEFMTQGQLKLIRQLEDENLLVLNNLDMQLGSAGKGFCDELPGNDYDPCHILTKNLWGFAQAQEFAGISDKMLEEFILPYQARVINQFGLSLYGCCDAMDVRVKSVEKYIKNLRMLSVSPVTNHEIAASLCEGKYVYAWKPQPTNVVFFDEKAIREEAERVFELTKKCCISVILLDVYTDEEPERFIKWLRIMRETANQI
jgi:hypothetical protein